MSVEQLSDAEILGGLIGTELPLPFRNLGALSYGDARAIAKNWGLSPNKTKRLQYAIEMTRRLSKPMPPTQRIGGPEDIFASLAYKINGLQQESFWSVCLDCKHQVLGVELIALGTLNQLLVHPREVFQSAILKKAYAIIIAHNHPSGDLTPSKEDIELTKRLKYAGEIIGIDVLDHVILSQLDYLSMRSLPAIWQQITRNE
jgi:DNA repair protein RadC